MQSLGLVENPPELIFYCTQTKVEDLVLLLLFFFYDSMIIDGLNELNPQLDLGKLMHKKTVVLYN